MNPGLTLPPSGLLIFTFLGPYSSNDDEGTFGKHEFSSLWTRQSCKQRHFNWFWSSSYWECLSLLKHAWHSEISSLLPHERGNRPCAICVKWTPNFDDKEHFTKMLICALPFSSVMVILLRILRGESMISLLMRTSYCSRMWRKKTNQISPDKMHH